MKKKYVRVGFTPAQKKELWERWRRGEQMKSIRFLARLLKGAASTISREVARDSGASRYRAAAADT